MPTRNKKVSCKKAPEIKTVFGNTAKIFIVPTYLTHHGCPYCSHYNFEEILEEEIGKKILTCCQACSEEYEINIQSILNK